jgi:O-antigen/teichoic acid export membrane protein
MVAPDAPPAELPDAAIEDRLALGGRSLRQHAARGTLVNAGFLIGLSALGLLKGFVVAAFLTRTDYGLWGALLVGLGTLVWLKDVGVADRYVQQDEPDQRAAFELAFTLELALNGLLALLLLAALPVLALIYGRFDLIPPGLALILVVPAAALQAPLWIYYRRMAFMRQRRLQAVDPLVSFAVTIGLAVAGAGVWSLVVGALAGSWSAAAVAVRSSPYPLRLRWDRRALRSYVSFSWPLLVAALGSLVVAQGSMIGGARLAGIAGAGAIALAASISQWTDRVDGILTSTLYPAICAVRQRTDLLFESFVKSNRLTLMWGLPFGIGLTLFGPDLVHLVLGRRWDPAIVLIQVFGAAAAINHVAFNWTAYFRAVGDTRPMAVASVATAIAFLGAALPLLALDGLPGFAIGMAIVTAAGIAVRTYYLKRLFRGYRALGHLLRAVAPTVPAAGVVLALRALEAGQRSGAQAAWELAVYLAVTALATWALERRLLREAAGYLRRAGLAQS